MFKGLQSENVCAKAVAHSAVRVGIIVESFMMKRVVKDKSDEMSLVLSQGVCWWLQLAIAVRTVLTFTKQCLECVNKGIVGNECGRTLRRPVRSRTVMRKERLGRQ